MTKRYHLFSLFLGLVDNAAFDKEDAFRLGAIIYRIKYLLLKLESCSEVKMNQICPMDELAELQALLEEAVESKKADLVRQRIEDGLKDVVARMEEANPGDIGGAAAYTLLMKPR